jgi:ketosteroid isomerase-like protein
MVGEVTEDKVDVVRRLYALWNEGDLDEAVGYLDPEVVAIGHPELPDPGPVHGRDAVGDWVDGLLEAWDEVAIDVEQVIDAGDQVVAVFHVSGRGKGSGVEVRSGRDAHVWTFRGEKVIGLRWYQGTVDALKAAGVT